MASLFVDALSVIDFSFLDAERGVVGESWIVDIELTGELNAEGMVFDFGHVKKLIKAEIDRGMDHRLVVPEQLPGLVITSDGDRVNIRLEQPEQSFVLDYTAPQQAFYWLPGKTLTMEAARTDIQKHLRSIVPANVTDIRVSLREELHNEAYYHYSHGLKKHAGDCQRMIHGHRSRIVIERDGKRDRRAERTLAQHWRDIYLVTQEDIVRERNELDIPCYDVTYTARQGQFDLTLPKARCIELPTDTTVELIAEHLLRQHATEAPESAWRVRAFEGVNKGAVAQYQPD